MIVGRAVKIEELGSDNGFEHIKWLFEAFRILPTRESAFPEAVYYNGNTTVCVFADGTKITARPMAGDSFDKATGVAMCIAKYVCGSRGRFHALVESGDDQTPELRGNAD